jgi:hypothetical protein
VIIYGYRTIVRQLAMITMVCARCHVQAPQQLNRRVKKFTLFFIPLFPISVWYLTRCTACGKSHVIRKANAMQLMAQAQGGHPQGQPYGQAQPYAPAQPYAQTEPYPQNQPYAQAQPYPPAQPYPQIQSAGQPYPQIQPFSPAQPYPQQPEFGQNPYPAPQPQYATPLQRNYGQPAVSDAQYGQPQGSAPTGSSR